MSPSRQRLSWTPHHRQQTISLLLVDANMSAESGLSFHVNRQLISPLISYNTANTKQRILLFSYTKMVLEFQNFFSKYVIKHFFFLNKLEGQNIQRFSSGNCFLPVLSVLPERRRDDRRICSISPKYCPYVIIANNYIIVVSYCSTAIITTNAESWYFGDCRVWIHRMFSGSPY